MICKQCNQAFNGSIGICHLCGTDHNEPIISKVEKIVDVQVQGLPVEKETEAPKYEKKKKGGR